MAVTADNFIIWIIKETLSDGSVAHNVELNGESFACITEHDAVELAEGIQELLEKHALVEVGVMYS